MTPRLFKPNSKRGLPEKDQITPKKKGNKANEKESACKYGIWDPIWKFPSTPFVLGFDGKDNEEAHTYTSLTKYVEKN
jgi:hypothetical protein